MHQHWSQGAVTVTGSNSAEWTVERLLVSWWPTVPAVELALLHLALHGTSRETKLLRGFTPPCLRHLRKMKQLQVAPPETLGLCFWLLPCFRLLPCFQLLTLCHYTGIFQLLRRPELKLRLQTKALGKLSLMSVASSLCSHTCLHSLRKAWTRVGYMVWAKAPAS